MPRGKKLLIDHHRHLLSLKRNLGLFECDGCGRYGFNIGYICRPCEFVMHQECFHSLGSQIESTFLSCPFNLRRFTSKTHKRCEACSEAIEKLGYECRDFYCKIRLHPTCVTSPKFLEISNRTAVLELKKTKNVSCYFCKRRKAKGSWAYISHETHLHIGCVMQILAIQGKRGEQFRESRHNSDIPILNLPRCLTMRGSGCFKG